MVNAKLQGTGEIEEDTGTICTRVGFSVVGTELAQRNYLLFLLRIMMVARDRIELPTRGFSEP